MMTAAFDSSGPLQIGSPNSVFAAGYTTTNTDGLRQYDIAPDGRFLMTKPFVESDSVAESPPRINVVLNWFQELTERVPVP